MQEINNRGTNERSSAIEGAVALMKEGLGARALEKRVRALQKSNLKKIRAKMQCPSGPNKKVGERAAQPSRRCFRDLEVNNGVGGQSLLSNSAHTAHCSILARTPCHLSIVTRE